MNRGKFWSTQLAVVGAALLAGSLLAAPAAAQTGSVTGRVLSAESGEPLAGVHIRVEGTDRQVLSQPNGRYLLLQVPAGTHTVNATLIGFASTPQTVTVEAGETTQLDLRLQPEAVALSEIVVTGVAGATQRTKLPFDVAQVRPGDLPVPSQNAGSVLTGKVAGVTVHQGSGRPGSAPSMLLRGVTSINASGRSQEPLYIVDGVILGDELVDLDALDIQSVEIVKGAAAASLYGSRASNGVVQIRTKRGAAMANDQVRYTVRSEYGRSGLASVPDQLLTQSHEYAMSADGLRFITTEGDECEWLRCGGRPALAGNAPWREAGETPSQWNSVQNVRWPGQTFDQVERFFESGDFLQNYVSAEGRAGATNFHVSVSNMQEDGI
ncbi:MAG: carboxypeptidase regulatory-like domain-containing protein, partial [Longimicrobiales bacterium]